MKIVINTTLVLTFFVTKPKQRTMCQSNSAQLHRVNVWNIFHFLVKSLLIYNTTKPEQQKDEFSLIYHIHCIDKEHEPR